MDEHPWLCGVKIREDLRAVESMLLATVLGPTQTLASQSKYILRRGGKRLRPTILLLSGSWGRDSEALLKAAVAVELIHTGSLCQDDIVDQSRLRRNSLTLHTTTNETSANLCAMEFYGVAFEIVMSLPEEVHEQAVSVAKDLCLGQFTEVMETRNAMLTSSAYEKIVKRKTASLYSLSTWLGAVLSKSSHEHAQILKHFGDKFGMLFQITDDLYDFFGTANATMGKEPHQDLPSGVFTLPVILWLEKSGRHMLARKLNDGWLPEPREMDLLASEISRTSVRSRLLERVSDLAWSLEQSIAKLPECDGKAALIGLVSHTYERASSLLVPR